MEVQTPEATYHLENLETLSIYKGINQTIEHFSSWDTTLYKRGFETIILAFIEAIQNKENPVSPQSSLLSRWICQQINKSTQQHNHQDVWI